MQPLFIGVDGGASKVIVRVEDESGNLLGEEIGGSANIRISVTQAWQSIHTALAKILQPLGISMSGKQSFLHAGMGLAGCEIPDAYHAFVKANQLFESLIITSDAHTACLGAHLGADGAVIIIGTGVVGYKIESGQTAKVGGWGFPHDDLGGGAWLGLEAIKITLQWLDRRTSISGLASAVFSHFRENRNELVTWANQANSSVFAELAPIVIQQSAIGDPIAIDLLKQAAQFIEKIYFALNPLNPHSLPCSLVGGIAPFVRAYLHDLMRDNITPCKYTPDVGAILLIRDQYRKQFHDHSQAVNTLELAHE